jgi:hypothetical protein
MSFYSDASLVLIPSGYKDQKVYSAVPTDGSGDLSFTRASDATRVASNGLIEKVRTNVLTYSQDFSNANWVGFDVSRTGTQTDPNGGTTASLYTSLTNSAAVSANFSTASASPYTLSIYIRGASSGVVSLRVDSGSTAAQNNISYTTSWQRFTYTFTAGSSTSTVVLGGYASFTTGEDIYVAFAQAELGDIATDYIATTAAAVSVGPVSGLPRLDYLGSTCPRLLLEPQRTNLLQYSEQLNNAYWTPDGGTITANTAVAPDGTTSMDRLTETATTNPHQVISTAVTIFGGAARTFSVFVKKGNVRYIQIANVAFGASSASAIFDLDTKTVTDNRASSGAGPAFSFVSASVEDYGNGILRLILVNTCSFDAPTYRIANSNQATFTGATLVDGMVSYAGNASSFTDIWGCQLESASYATSYIPTLGASVTRVADAALKTGITSLIGQTEGTIFIDFIQKAVGASVVQIQLNDGSNSNRVQLEVNSSGIGVMYVFSGGGLTGQINLGTFTAGTRYKVSMAYKVNDFVAYINGVSAGTDTSGAVPVSMSRIDLGAEVGTSYTGYELNQALLFKTRLTNESLASLTIL